MEIANPTQDPIANCKIDTTLTDSSSKQEQEQEGASELRGSVLPPHSARTLLSIKASEKAALIKKESKEREASKNNGRRN
jgi:hypothetical protein